MKVWTDDGASLDAEFSVEEVSGRLTIVYEQGGAGRNKEYGPGLDLLLARLGDAEITAIYLERKREHLPAEDRLIAVKDHDYPIRVPADARSLRHAIGRAVAAHRRAEDAKGSGNRQKRIRFHTGRAGDPVDWERQLGRERADCAREARHARRIQVEAAHVVEYAVETASNRTAVRREQQLVLRYEEFMGAREFTLSRYEYQIDGRRLYSDLYVDDHDILVEAKAKNDRAALRLAVGQLLDYRRFHEKRPALAVLLPAEPEPDMKAFLASVDVDLVWEAPDAGYFKSMNPVLGETDRDVDPAP